MMADELGASAEDRPPRRAAARHRQGRLARGRGPARARRRRPRAPPRRVRGRRPRDGGPPQRGRAADDRGGDRAVRRRAVAARGRAPAASRSSTTSSACASSSRSRRATTASRRSTRCRPAARSASSSRRARIDDDGADAALARDRPRDRAGARVPGPDQGHGHPRVARGGVREVAQPGVVACRCSGMKTFSDRLDRGRCDRAGRHSARGGRGRVVDLRASRDERRRVRSTVCRRRQPRAHRARVRPSSRRAQPSGDPPGAPARRSAGASTVIDSLTGRPRRRHRRAAGGRARGGHRVAPARRRMRSACSPPRCARGARRPRAPAPN